MLLFFAFAYVQAGLIPVLSTTPACHGNDGGVTITGTGVPGPFFIYIYGNGISRGDSNVVSSSNFTGLAPGNYQFDVYCNSAQQAGTFSIASADSITITTTQPVCPAGTTGSAVATAVTGASPFSYLWSNGATTQSVNGLPLGINSVTVTDANGCYTSAYDSVHITSPVNGTITHTGPTCGGALVANASAGTAPYSFLWNTGATTASITGLISGDYYDVTITDANGCIGSAYTYVAHLGLAFDTVNSQVTPPSCGSNGSIRVVMLTGTAPYTFAWSNGATGATINGLAQGSYYVTATDANGCTGQTYYYLNSNSLVEYSYSTNPDCGVANGSIDAYAYGGTTPYTYTWSNTNTNHLYRDSLLVAGTYHFTVTDAHGCAIADSAVLIPQGNFAAQVTGTPIICPATTGTLTVNVTGAGPYTYLWSNGATTQTLSNVPETQSFSVTATDGGGCQTTAWSDTMSIQSPVNISLNAAPCGTSLAASATGGVSPYHFAWSTGATTATITYAPYTWYYLTVTDAQGCSGYQSFVQYRPGIQLDSMHSVTNPTCSTQGSITANPLSGTAPYTYLWSNGATTTTISGLAGGYYEVTATDANGCSGVGYYYLNENTLSSNIYPTNPGCGSSDGSVTLTPYNGTAPYSFSWSNSSTNHTSSSTSLAAGTYAFTVTDAGGCTYSGSTTLTAQGAFIANVSSTPTSCAGTLPTGTVTAVMSNGGTSPFTFNWLIYGNNGQNSTLTTNTSSLTGLAYGTWVELLSVIDANGCEDSYVGYQDSAYITYDPNCYDHITGYAYTDANGDCVKNTGEAGIANLNVQTISDNGQNYYATTDATGFYDIAVLPGNYAVSAYTYSYGYCSPSTCNSLYNDTLINTGLVSSGNNFGFSSSGAFDLVVHPGCLSSQPGSSKEYWVYYYNQGSLPASNVVLTFIHDPNVTLTYTNPTYTSYNQATHTITWNLGTVPVSYLGTNQQVIMNFDVPANLSLGYAISAIASLSPVAGDCDQNDNVESITDVVSASHDPNEKQVSPTGNILPTDSVLNYTIRFQNTGNAAATRVVIKDTLSPLVNPASIEMGASNYPYKYTLSGNGILTITFDPINLPDSSHGVDSSSGFVKYSVKVRNSTSLGSRIKNTAFIYFDINPAVVTNTTVNTVSLFGTGIKTINTSAMNISVSPNPVHDKSLFTIDGATGEVSFEITDVTGRKVFETNTTDRNITLESEAYASGMYVYTARDTKGNICSGKIIIAH